MLTREYQSPCGGMLIGVHGPWLVMTDWTEGDRAAVTLRRIQRHLPAPCREDDSALLDRAAEELDEYFECRRIDFDLPLLLAGTEFQQEVWRALKTARYGKTCSYREIAEAIGRPSAVRAVANAIGANPLSVIIPCHRIIGSDGSLTGYAGGLNTKEFLLSLEND